MYGAYWCPHCADQKAMFEASFKYVPYVECGVPGSRDEAQVCKDAGIKHFPTWEFADGERREGTLTLQSLGTKTGCDPAMTPFARRILLLIAVLALAGALVSSVSLYHHYGSSETSYCDFGESFNCDIVNRSIYSVFLGIPVALIGMVGYLAPLALATFYRSKPETPAILADRFAGRVGLRALPYLHRRVCPGGVVHLVSVVAGPDFQHRFAVFATVDAARPAAPLTPHGRNHSFCSGRDSPPLLRENCACMNSKAAFSAIRACCGSGCPRDTAQPENRGPALSRFLSQRRTESV